MFPVGAEESTAEEEQGRGLSSWGLGRLPTTWFTYLICVPPGMCQGKVRLSSGKDILLFLFPTTDKVEGRGTHSCLLPCLKMAVNVPASSIELLSRAPDKAV